MIPFSESSQNFLQDRIGHFFSLCDYPGQNCQKHVFLAFFPYSLTLECLIIEGVGIKGGVGHFFQNLIIGGVGIKGGVGKFC